ncbi:MAG: putative sporulation protein YtxC [Clostridiales bacterium]|jgi:hypothetical protein|nr:putative sporulation protein YtxC [Clostridiales bacterium]
MLKRRIDTGEYDIDALRLLERRLGQTAREYALTPSAGGVEVEIVGDDAMQELTGALSLLLLRDLSRFELAYMADKLPLSVAEKQEVLANSIHCAKKSERLGTVRRKLAAYLANEDALHLSGYMRFRMPEMMSAWKLCVQSAMEELLLEKEYVELMGVLRAFVDMKPARVREISLLLNPDGSCTLTDDSDARVDYAYCDPDKLVGVLMDLAPERLTVYDLSGKPDGELAETLKNVFQGRVRFLH